jgi:hypothetical protein
MKSVYGIKPSGDGLVALDTMNRRAAYGDIGKDQAERTFIQAATYGIGYALGTGRLCGKADIAVRALKGGAMSLLVRDIVKKELLSGSVPAYLNKRYG